MSQKQIMYTVLIGLSVILTACDSSKQVEKETDTEKNTGLASEQAEVLPYLNIQKKAAEIAQPFCETKNCIELDIQTLKTEDAWLNRWIASSQSQVIQAQIGLKQNMSLQQAINAYVKKSDAWQAEFSRNKPYSLALYTRIPYQRNQYVLMQIGVDSKQENINVKERYYFFVADRKTQKAVALLDLIQPKQQLAMNVLVQDAYQDWLKTQEPEVRNVAPVKLYWGQADWFFDQEGIGLHYRTHEIVKDGTQLDIYLTKAQTEKVLKPDVYHQLF